MDAELADRLSEIRQRVESLLARVDVRGQIDRHPWELVGAAALVGAWIGFDPPHVRVREPSAIRRRMADALLTAVGAIAIRLVREAAFRQVADIAKRWWDESAGTGSEIGPDREAQARGEDGRSDRGHSRSM